MKFAVGYPVGYDEDFSLVEALEPCRGSIQEVYFSWPGEPSGRWSPRSAEEPAEAAVERLESDLQDLRAMGIRLDLLFNANCYGHLALSQSLEANVCSLVDRVAGTAGLDAITTTSPFVAWVVKRHYPAVEVRASVNMRIGTVQAAEYLAETFDGFYLQREYNRDFARIEEFLGWCRSHGKGLFLLANSGCLSFCSTQSFHDNTVAHEAQIVETANVACDVLACRNYLKNPDHWPAILQATWIRPEDMARYEPYFPFVKLATRMHHNPLAVISAYVNRTWSGNLLDLLEPGYGPLLQGHFVDNTRFPADWFDRVTGCGHKCHACSYCRQTLDRVLL